jgi:uncharacterized protein
MMSPSEPKPRPVPDADSAPFWAACQAGRLTAQQCSSCGACRWPPRGVCPVCSSWTFDWREVPATGVVRSFVVPHRAFSPAFAAEVPYVVAHVAIDGTAGRVVLVSQLRVDDWQQVRVGQVVDVIFDEAGLPGFTLR